VLWASSELLEPSSPSDISTFYIELTRERAIVRRKEGDGTEDRRGMPRHFILEGHSELNWISAFTIDILHVSPSRFWKEPRIEGKSCCPH